MTLVEIYAEALQLKKQLDKHAAAVIQFKHGLAVKNIVEYKGSKYQLDTIRTTTGNLHLRDIQLYLMLLGPHFGAPKDSKPERMNCPKIITANTKLLNKVANDLKEYQKQVTA